MFDSCAFSAIYTIINLTNEAILTLIDHFIWWYKSLHARGGAEMFFMSCKSFHDFKTVLIQNQMILEATENEVQKQLLTQHKRKAKYSFRTWDARLRAGGTLWFSPEVLYFITVINILKEEKKIKINSVNLFSLIKKVCLKISVKHPFYSQQTYCSWDMFPKKLWA